NDSVEEEIGCCNVPDPGSLAQGIPSSSNLRNSQSNPGRFIKSTRSLCPACLQHIDAAVFERDGEVWMDKRCGQHGEFSVLLSSEARHYYSARPSTSLGSCCGPAGCGTPGKASNAQQLRPNDAPGQSFPCSPWTNHSCTVLIEIIERCNLSCPTCFAGSSPQHDGLMSLQEFTRQVDGLVAGGKRGADMIQLSGGEPTIHPKLVDMIDLLFQRGFTHVTINSNGIKLAQPAFVKRLAEVAARHPSKELFIYLQFDGFDAGTHQQLRGRDDLLDIKRRAIELCHLHGISVHPVMTLTRGINDHEVGDFIRLAVEQPQLKNVVVQPAMYSGRYDNPRRDDRITLADTVNLVCDQFGVFQPEDFMPIPCSDPNCFGMATAVRTRRGLQPLSRFLPRYEDWGNEAARGLIDTFSNTINGPAAMDAAVQWVATGAGSATLAQLDDAEVDQLLDALLEAQQHPDGIWSQLLTISIKPFMDAWSYDQDRIDACCVHILDREGKPVSFCEYNALTRPTQLQVASKAKLPLELRA
ncbi:MAG TPA: radical SAM protein, partial [Xanthomonadales bacterium]|nr:radical SAM protein [Xanthomonadales bacterium]